MAARAAVVVERRPNALAIPVQAVVEQADTIFLSLPDGAIVNQVAEEIAAGGFTERRYFLHELDCLLEEMGRLQEQLDHRNAWDLDSQLEQAMDALRCPPGDADVTVLSGG